MGCVDEVRTRLYVNGSVVHEDHWRIGEGLSQLERIMRRYGHTVAQAKRDGAPYAVEIHDPDGPPTHRTARWGTDSTVMDNPSAAPSRFMGELGLYVDGCMDARHHAEGGCFAHSLN